MKEKIEQILVRHDPIGLIRMGAPQDEYEQEAQLIYERTTRHFAREKIQDIIYEIFIQKFSGGSCFATNHGVLEYTGEQAPSLTKAIPIIGYYDNYKTIALEIKALLDG
jgi:hypothetical protein